MGQNKICEVVNCVNGLAQSMTGDNDLKLLAFGDEESGENETKNALETMNKWKKNKKVKNDHLGLTVFDNRKSSKMMNVIRSKLNSSKKRKHCQMDDNENENQNRKKVKMSQESKEYELSTEQ